MGSVGFPLKLSACILIFLILENFCVTSDEHWCYNDPKCGPNTWGPIGSCSGKKQSPINIESKAAKHKSNFESIYFSEYENLNIAKKVWNTGHYAQINFEVKATISGPGFSAKYYLWQCHFHWGTENSNGAEHTIDGKRYAMEMHLVHTKNNMTIEEASKQSDGFVVLAFLLEVDKEHKQVTPWDTLARLFKEIPEKDDSYDVKGEFSMGGLLHTADFSHYYRYSGSLTSPPCAEAVDWIVFPYPIYLSYQVANIMRTSLYFTTIKDNRPMENNFRPTQDLNGREVYYYTEHKSLFTCIGYCFSRWF
ncbi:putative carbonic anhydrase 3 [Pantherophis guttatus]|uniref:Carbonic anhydrase 3 n=1 Tax=Pantherophis guttatus TaxID=94885 RepID=A0A6P9BZR7_PANGU|nr:putative carbonic anhydrase 3 [Pantherophis guttatus]